MKKNKYIIVGLLASAMTLTSCSDSFLEVESPTQKPISEYFSTDAHLQEAVIACYDPMHWPDWAMGEYNPVNIMSDIMGDDFWVGGSDKTDNDKWHLMFNYEATPVKAIVGLWTDAYSGVKRCNDLLAYTAAASAENDPEITTEKLKSYEAQALTLRAFYYTWLWKFWGNVPYFTDNLEEQPYLADQIQAEDLYANIVKDIEDAIALNVLPMHADDDELGRVTKAMAYMLYAEVVLYQNDQSRFSKALDYMKEIIADPQYDLASDFTTIFTAEGEWSVESIFEINYKSENSTRDWGNPQGAGGTVLPTLISPNNWPNLDGHGAGWGFAPVRTSTYEMYDAADTRRDATCWNAGAISEDYNKRYQDTGFFLEKYAYHLGDDAGQKASAELNHNENLRIYRYAETLLNAAELSLRTGGSETGDAKEWLNDVRSRANLNNLDKATLDDILKERHFEFVGEGKRYWDLVRAEGISGVTEKASLVLTPAGENGETYRTNTWTASKKYLPIPQSEVDKALGTLTQNNY